MSEIIEVIKDVTTVTIASDGPQGPAGPLGPTGPTGPEGAAGAPGSSGVISVVAPITNTGTSTSAIIGINSGVANGVATLDSNGKVPQSQIPAVAITNTFVVASQAAMLALTAEEGDVAVRTDQNKTYILTATPSSTLANWQELLTPTDTVTSVDGRIGTVTLTDKYAQLATANTFTGGVQQITTASAATIGLIVKATASQSANLQEWQDSSANPFLRVNSVGSLLFGPTTAGSFLSGANGRVFVLTNNAAIVPVTVQGFASQTANLQEWQNSAGTIVAKINQVGSAVFGNATINAAGNLNAYASTTTTIPMVVRGAASQTANLQEWQNSAGTVLFSITSGGAFGNQVTANAGIDVVGGGNALRSIAGAATVVPIVARGAASQTADLQQWQNSGGTVLAKIESGGALNVSPAAATNGYSVYMLGLAGAGILSMKSNATSAHAIQVQNSANTVVFKMDQEGRVVPSAAASVGLIVRGAASQTADLQQWQDSGGTVASRITSAGSFAAGTAVSATAITANLSYLGPTGIGITVRGAASQTADLQRWQDSGGTVLTAVTPAGTINFASGNTSATANTGAVALPALAVGFITMQVAGTTVKVPYYAN